MCFWVCLCAINIVLFAFFTYFAFYIIIVMRVFLNPVFQIRVLKPSACKGLTVRTTLNFFPGGVSEFSWKSLHLNSRNLLVRSLTGVSFYTTASLIVNYVQYHIQRSLIWDKYLMSLVLKFDWYVIFVRWRRLPSWQLSDWSLICIVADQNMPDGSVSSFVRWRFCGYVKRIVAFFSIIYWCIT